MYGCFLDADDGTWSLSRVSLRATHSLRPRSIDPHSGRRFASFDGPRFKPRRLVATATTTKRYFVVGDLRGIVDAVGTRIRKYLVNEKGAR